MELIIEESTKKSPTLAQGGKGLLLRFIPAANAQHLSKRKKNLRVMVTINRMDLPEKCTASSEF